MPFTLSTLTGATIAGINWNSVEATNDTNNSSTYDLDIASQRTTSSGQLLKTLVGLGTSTTLELSIDEFQLHHSDVSNLKKLYSLDQLNKETIESFKVAINNIKKFHQKQLQLLLINKAVLIQDSLVSVYKYQNQNRPMI